MKGRKTCPQCQSNVSSFTILCQCGLDFSKIPKPVKIPKVKEVKKEFTWRYKGWVYACGLPKPYEPLEDWISEVRQEGARSGKLISNECIYRVCPTELCKEILELDKRWGPCIPTLQQMLDSDLYFADSKKGEIDDSVSDSL